MHGSSGCLCRAGPAHDRDHLRSPAVTVGNMSPGWRKGPFEPRHGPALGAPPHEKSEHFAPMLRDGELPRSMHRNLGTAAVQNCGHPCWAGRSAPYQPRGDSGISTVLGATKGL